MTRNAAYLPKGVIGVVISLLITALVLLLITASQPTRVAVADDEPQSESKKTALQLQQQIEEAQEAYAACREEA